VGAEQLGKWWQRLQRGPTKRDRLPQELQSQLLEVWPGQPHHPRLLRPNNGQRHRATGSPEAGKLDPREKEKRGGGQGGSGPQTSKSCPCQNRGRGHAGSRGHDTAVSLGRRIGFLGGWGSPHPRSFPIICGTNQKRKGPEKPSTGTSQDRQRRRLNHNKASPEKSTNKPQCGKRPITTMIVSWGPTQHTVWVLLDTGGSVPLISTRITEQLDIPRIRRSEAAPLLNCLGEEVKGAGMEYTKPLLLQHRKHYSREVFEVAPLEPVVDLFPPFWWIAKHPPQGAWDSEELRFSSHNCLEKCTQFETEEFPLSLDETVTRDPKAKVIGYVSAINEEDRRDQRSKEFRGDLDIMSREAAEALPTHQPYDCKIGLKEGETAPWGPIYPLPENELRTLREWLKEMLRTGKIRRSTSPAGSPILFVPKPNGKGLRLCVDYQALNRITIPNRYPLPLMQELQGRVQRARWFTKLDLKNGFNLIRIREGDEWKTAFRTRYGLYEF